MTPTPTTDSAVSPVSDERLKQLQFEVSAIEPSRRISMSSEDRRDLLSIFAELALSRRSLDTADGVEPDLIEAIGAAVFGRHERGFVMWPLMGRDEIESNIRTVLASRTPNTEMVVKLEWDGSEDAGEWIAETICGRYMVSDEGAAVVLRFNSSEYQTVIGEFGTEQAAFAAAQADFDKRIRSALASPPSPAEVTEGWVLVPKEPTDAMYQVGWDDHLHPSEFRHFYALMLAALQLNKKG